MNCPKCSQKMTKGYSAATVALSWVDKEKFSSRIFFDEDLSGAGFKKFLPAKAEYFRAERCVRCECVFIDHSRKLSRKSVEREIRLGIKEYC